LCFQFHRQNSWSISLADNVYRPIHTLPYRYNAFKCHSFLAPRQPFELTRLKTAATAFTRSLNAIQDCSLLPKLTIAVGLSIFSVWGLVPLIRLTRNLFRNVWVFCSFHFVNLSHLCISNLFIASSSV
jgi:hypothetical protein